MRIGSRVASLPPTIFSEMSALALAHGAINLGQGFPDFDGPGEVLEAAISAIRGGINQYPPGAGAASLRSSIAHHSERFYGQRVDPDSMITVTSGATEALFDAIVGLTDPGDEVILFEPFYDSYEASVRIASAVPRFVLLRPPDSAHAQWWFEPSELAAAFGPRTRVVVVNTPHNPTGKVFSEDELRLIAELCVRHDAVALVDEVYEHIVFPPARHVRLATLPGMAERTVTVSSGGKSFSLTGWKVGWAIAAPPLRLAVQQAHQYVTFATAAPLQAGIAHALRLPDAYFDGLRESYLKRRDTLVAALAAAGLRPLIPEGAYFALADLSGTRFTDDVSFCRHLTAEVGVAAIPPSAFYSAANKQHGSRHARFAFCKTDAVLAAARIRLEGFHG